MQKYIYLIIYLSVSKCILTQTWNNSVFMSCAVGPVVQ